MNLQELRYFVAIAEHRHFGRAAEACHVSQPTLSGQLRKLEEHLGVVLFERNNKRVSLTPVGEKTLIHARKALEEASYMEAIAKSSSDPLSGPLKLGVIPTLAPYLMPLILGPLQKAYPQLTIELWEDLTLSLVDLLRTRQLDAALIATDVPGGDLTAINLFIEPFFATLPANHSLAGAKIIQQSELAKDVLILADGHCLATQTLAACGRKSLARGSYRAASLDTLVNLVAAGYGTTLVPGLAASTMRDHRVVFIPLQGRASRTIRLACRTTFPRPQAIKAVETAVRKAVASSPWERVGNRRSVA